MEKDIKKENNIIEDNFNKELINNINPDLTFGILKGKAEAYVKGEITREELNEWSNSLVILASLPMELKTACLITLTTKYFYSDTEQTEIIVTELYKNLFFEVYLRYLGITTIYPEENNYTNYDLMEPLYGPWIEMIAGRDIAKFKEMLNNSLTLTGSIQIVNAVDEIDMEAMNKANIESRKMLEEMEANEKLISNLKELMTFDNPILKDAIEKLAQEEYKNNQSSDK